MCNSSFWRHTHTALLQSLRAYVSCPLQISLLLAEFLPLTFPSFWYLDIASCHIKAEIVAHAVSGICLDFGGNCRPLTSAQKWALRIYHLYFCRWDQFSTSSRPKMAFQKYKSVWRLHHSFKLGHNCKGRVLGRVNLLYMYLRASFSTYVHIAEHKIPC